MTDLQPHSHCHRCGTPYVQAVEGQEWPRKCPACGNLQFFNPVPIGVMLQRVRDRDRVGIVTPLRGIEPMRGHPALTGGYTDGWDQSSEEAGSREVNEEIELPRIAQEQIRLLTSQATGPFIPGRRQLLTFSLSPTIVDISHFDGWTPPNGETLAMEFSWEPRVLAFPSHTRAMAVYFRDFQGVEPPAHYIHQPRTGDTVHLATGTRTVFEVPYAQPTLDDGVWQVLLVDAGTTPVGVVLRDGAWRIA